MRRKATNTKSRRRPQTGAPRDDADGERSPEISKGEIACWAALLVVTVGALIWKHSTVFFYSWTDEQIHLYVAHRMAQGAVLYRDIQSARPPLVLLPVAWLIKMGCSPLLAGRAVVLGSQLGTAGLLLWGGRRLVSWRAGALTALLFLSSPEVFSRINYTAIQPVELTATACVLFSLMAQPLRAGLFFGLTLATDQHGLVVCGVVAVLTVVQRPRDALLFALGAFAVGASVFGGVWAMGGKHLWNSLVGLHVFHFNVGEGVSGDFWEMATPWLYEHVYLFVGAGLAVALMGAKRTKDAGSNPSSGGRRGVRVLFLVVCVHIAVVLAMTGAAFLYVVVIVPMLALLAGIGFDAAVSWWRRRVQFSRSGARRASRLLLAGASTLVALTLAGWSAARSYRENLDQRHYSFLPHVLHGQVSRSQELVLAQGMAGKSILPRGGTIFGDPMIVSVLALESGTRVSADLADLNPRWIEAGTVRREDVVSRIEHDRVALVVTPPWFLVHDPFFKSYLSACYEKPQLLTPPEDGPGSGLPDILVFPHRLDNSPCNAPMR